ncbi:hypothetical protein RHMOL_Rhmol04G0172200 [Rhododendron molle]|uniref:Uncharacterized protein n=1 Tax=Rhododendron molle TaxID=49168 RepID=A0ACC0P1B3_RHOML|nr:hypothetical protein RHMOL_Rhmol04G0172200 [Rhododendron molle]
MTTNDERQIATTTTNDLPWLLNTGIFSLSLSFSGPWFFLYVTARVFVTLGFKEEEQPLAGEANRNVRRRRRRSEVIHWFHMDSSSSTSTNADSLPRYAVKLCGCNDQAIIRVTNSEPNRGKIYYSCPNNRKCDMWEWCRPINRRQNRGQSVTTQRRASHEDKTQNPTLRVQNARIGDDNAMAAKIQVLEGQQANMKMMIVCLTTVVFCLLYCSVLK